MWECQLADSEVAALQRQGGQFTLRFSALSARAVATGQPASDWGYALGVLLRLDGAELVQQDPHALGRIAEGRLEQGGIVVPAWALPAQHTGPVTLQLRFANGGRLLVQAQGWHSDFVDGPRFRESYAC